MAEDLLPVTILIEHGKPPGAFMRDCDACFAAGLTMAGYSMNVVTQSVYRSAIFRGSLTAEEAAKLNEIINPKVQV